MSLLDRFKKKPKTEQAVIVALTPTGVDQAVYDQNDLSTLEDQIIQALQDTGLGAFDGNEIGPSGCTLYLYGPDAEALYAKIDPILCSHPLCQSAQVTIRQGRPEAQQREVRI